MRYALGLLKEFHASPLEIEREQYVILYGGAKPLPIAKTTTVPRRSKVASTQPDKAYKRDVLNGSRLYLRELLE